MTMLTLGDPDIDEDVGIDTVAIDTVAIDTVERFGSRYLVIGGGVRVADVATDARVRRELPALSESLSFATPPELGNITTVAGSVVSSMCDCFRVALVAFDAVVDVENERGTRAVALSGLRLRPDERIACLRVPLTPSGQGSTSVKISERASDAPPLLSCTVVVTVRNGEVEVCRIAVGGDGLRPRRANDAEQLLAGRQLTIDRARAVANTALQVRDHGFEHELERRMVTDALHIAAARAERGSR
jgi:xanthine dehydrogenase YagS FAD-binding subunit